MKSILILYKSKYGAAKEYAQMLAEKLKGDLLENKKVSPKQILPYDAIIYCGGVYAGGIAGISLLWKNAVILRGKRLAIFAVGASPYDEKAIAQISARILSGLPENTPLFYGRGAWDESVLTAGDKILVGMLKRAVSKKAPSDMEPWEQALSEAMGKKCSWVEEKYLLPLIRYMSL